MVGGLPALLWGILVAAPFYQTSESDFKHLQEIKCDNNTSTTSEMGYLQPILCKSECQPRETFVQVWHEFPEEMHHIITPPCVPVQRCRGYCGDEATVCTPEKNDTVLVQVLRDTGEMIELPFVQHSACSCRGNGLQFTYVLGSVYCSCLILTNPTEDFLWGPTGTCKDHFRIFQEFF